MVTFLDIAINNCCTYRCSYCASNATRAWARNFEQTGKDPVWSYMNCGFSLKPHFLIKYLKNFHEPHNTVVQLSGGEPLLHDSIVTLIETIASLGYRTIVNTNGNQLRTLGRAIDVTELPCRWRLSWHRECRDFNAFCEDIAPLTSKLSSPSDYLINYILHPRDMHDRAFEIHFEELIKANMKFQASPFIGEWEGHKYDFTDPIYKGWTTASNPKEDPVISPPFAMLTIRPDGSIFGCHTKPMGDIFNGPSAIVQKATMCHSLENGSVLCPLAQAGVMMGCT